MGKILDPEDPRDAAGESAGRGESDGRGENAGGESAGRAADTARFRRIEDLFHAALARRPEEQAAFLAAECAGDPTLAAEVATLLTADSRAGDFLEAAVADEAALLAAAWELPRPGERVGPYRLERELGRGGMGAVYLAVREDGEYRRQVALKLLRPGAGGLDLVRRFRTERQILAGLEHPNIARLYDGGTDVAGRPYLVLERVEGRPIDEHCDALRLGIPARLELFRVVCAAVAHAHRHLVVHRDLKPSNVLVTAEGTVKLLDFGIAKLVEPEEPGREGAGEGTATVVRALTPRYASPEQVLGAPVTTGTDVYSLGVLLYELLAGRSPYRLAGDDPEALARAVCDQEPERPSVAAVAPAGEGEEAGSGRQGAGSPRGKPRGPEEIARGRATSPRELRRRLAGDLDTIALTALQKARDRRYGTVEELAEDVRRHLSSRPVTARRDTFGYRAGKLVRRHRPAVALAGALAVALAAFLWSTIAQARRLAVERDKAERSLAFLIDLFEVADPGESEGEVTARDVLDRGAVRVDRDLAAQPEIRAALLDTLGRVYTGLGHFDRAEPLLRRALALRRQALGDDHLDVAASLTSLGDLLARRGDLAEAGRSYRQALALRRAHLGSEHPDVATSLDKLADLLHDQGDYAAAEPLYREALALRRALFGGEHPDVATSLNNLALLLHDRAEYAAAEPLYREALGVREKLLGEMHLDVATSLNNLAALLEERNDPDGAERLLRRSLAIHRRVLGERHASTATVLQHLAALHEMRGHPQAAEPLYRQALAIQLETLGADHPDRASNLHNLARVRRAQGDFAEAEALFRQAAACYRRRLPPRHPYLAHPLLGLGELLLRTGRAREAEALLAEALAIRRLALPAGSWRTAEAASFLGECRRALGRPAEAAPLLTEGYQGLRAALGEADPRTRHARQRLAALAQDGGPG